VKDVHKNIRAKPMKEGGEIPPIVIFAHEAEMTGALAFVLAAIIYLSIRRWGRRGWIASILVVPLAAIWWVAYPIVATGFG
jgi:hypothetical protein